MKRTAIIAYDIIDNKKRRQVFRCLQQWKLSSQYSVFECLLNQKQADEILLQLTEIIDLQQDKLLFVWLDNHRTAQALTKCAELNFKKLSYYIG